MEIEFVPVSKEFKSRVIGKGGSVLNGIRQSSGARITSNSREEEGFTVSGDVQQVAIAKRLILEKVEEIKINTWEEVEIPDECKGLIIGKGGANLREISKETGAEVIRKGGEVHITKGTEKQREQAKLYIRMKTFGARLRGVENEFNKVCCFIDGWNLPENCKLKLEKVPEKDRMVLTGSQAQYRLKPSKEYDQQESVSDSSYLSKLHDVTLESLHKMKGDKESNNYVEADMWCHFGSAMIRGPSEEDAEIGEWSIDEATAMFQPSEEGNYWKVAFQEGVNFIEDIFKGNYYENTPEEYLEYDARYDLTFLTPCSYQLRCKVWVARKDAKKKLEDIPIPFNDVKNILVEIQFEDETTRSQCRGWLVLPSRRYLQADILFPGCEFDCRLTVRERTEGVIDVDYVPKQEVICVLARYLSELTLTEGDVFGLRLPEKEMPKGFHLIHKRFTKRTAYTSSKPGFSIILSKEISMHSVTSEETSRESTDLHLHCEEWDRLLSTGQWEPEIIIRKLPEFLEFVKEVQGFFVREMKRNVLERKVPPEILARGPLALEVYNNALADGKTCVKRVPLMLVGQDRSGKTSVKKSLKGICFDPEEDSTMGIDVDSYHFKVTTEIWMAGKKDEEANIDAAAISFEHNAARWIADKLMREENATDLKRTSLAESESYDFDVIHTLEEGDSSESPSNTEPFESPRDQAPTDTTHGEDHFPTGEEHNPTELEPEDDVLNTTQGQVPAFEDVANLIQKFLQDDWTEDREDIHSIMWDFAGQSVYYVTHPLFLTRRAIYFLVYDLSRDPNDKAKPLVKQGVYETFQDQYNLKTNLDYLEFWMNSLASLARQTECKYVNPESRVLPKKLPAVFLVCTHADKPYGGHSPCELANRIFGTLKSKPYGAQLFDVFCVDNTKSGTNSECEEIMRLREAVHEVAKELPHVNEAIPIKWLKYEKALRIIKENDRKFISLTRAKQIASKVCDINNNNEILTLLNFLHDLRVLIHFDDTPELDNLVILDPQWLIDVFKNVITVRPYHWKERNFADLWYKLEKQGILEETLFKHVWSSVIPQTETHESLIAIMEKFSLLCPWPSSHDSCNKHYLVPSMLQTHPPKRISDLVESAQLPSLFLKFETGQVPAGLFPRFVLEFFQWCREEFSHVAPPQFFNNFARFFIFPNQGLSVVLLCHSSTVEVIVLSGDSDTDIDDVASTPDFRSQLALMIDRVLNKFSWVKNVRCEVSFLCPVCCRGSAVNFCAHHNKEGCKQEECLHFFAESELGEEVQVVCTRSATAQDNRVQLKKFAPWIPSGEGKQLIIHQRDGRLQAIVKGGNQEKSHILPCDAVESIQLQPRAGSESDGTLVPFAQGYRQIQPLVNDQLEVIFLQEAVNESDGTLVPVSEGHEEVSLVLPDSVSGSLQSQSNPPKAVVGKMLQNLQLDDASLKLPEPETKKWIRCLARNAKYCERTDVVKYLRENTPAGTTGPLLEERLDVRKIPFRLSADLAVRLCGGDEWKVVADKLGFNGDYIRCFDNRFRNPFKVILDSCTGLNVGQLYDVLVECEFPVLADLL